jgi:hypothetical protein
MTGDSENPEHGSQQEARKQYLRALEGQRRRLFTLLRRCADGVDALLLEAELAQTLELRLNASANAVRLLQVCARLAQAYARMPPKIYRDRAGSLPLAPALDRFTLQTRRARKLQTPNPGTAERRGPGAPQGNANALKTGVHTRKMRRMRRRTTALVAQAVRGIQLQKLIEIKGIGAPEGRGVANQLQRTMRRAAAGTRRSPITIDEL